MSNLDKRNNGQIAKGSLSDIARASGLSLAEAFISCDAVVLVDTSRSMNTEDALDDSVDRADHPSGQMLTSRYKAACWQLAKLQAELPGKVAVVAFSSIVEFCPSGYPRYIGAGTAMHKALEFIKVADGCGIKLVLISDGQPDAPDETLRIARTFISHIDTVYVGREGDSGAAFLRELAAATGGHARTQATNQLNELSQTVRLMLEG